MCNNCFKVFNTIIMIFSICLSFTISSFAGYSTAQLTDNNIDERSLQVNRSEKMDPENNPGNDGEIFIYNGTNILQLTDNDDVDVRPRINNSGEVVWYGKARIAPPRRPPISGWELDFGGGGGCLISTAAYGFRMSKKIFALALLFVSILIFFIKLEKKNLNYR